MLWEMNIDFMGVFSQARNKQTFINEKKAKNVTVNYYKIIQLKRQ